MSIKDSVLKTARAAREASRRLAKTDTKTKNAALLAMAEGIESRRGYLASENEKDVKAGLQKGLSPALIDRLTLSGPVIDSMAASLCEVAALPDPVGEVTGMWRRPNGLLVGRQRIPLGVIGIIYEARPNVTADAAGLCLKSRKRRRAEGRLRGDQLQHRGGLRPDRGRPKKRHTRGIDRHDFDNRPRRGR